MKTINKQGKLIQRVGDGYDGSNATRDKMKEIK